MSHHENNLSYAERVETIDLQLAHHVSQWREELTTDQYKGRIRELLDDLDEASKWIGKEGNNANRLHRLTKEYYESFDRIIP